MKSLDKEFCEYLKKRPFNEFMCAWKKQYERLGTVGGTIHLPLNDQNREAIEMLMQKNYHRQNGAKIAYSALRKALENTMFSEVDFNQVLVLYFNGEIITKKDRKELKNEEEEIFIDELLLMFDKSKASFWLEKIRNEKESTIIRIYQEFHKSKTETKKVLMLVMKAINQLPLISPCSLTVFSSQTTSDPHAFDKGTFANYLLMSGISSLDNRKEDYRLLLHKMGLYEDAVSNFCMVCHLSAFDLLGEIHQGWHGFYNAYEMWNMNMANISSILDIDVTHLKIIFVVENPSVFQVLCDEAKRLNYQQYAFICTNGQLHNSAYILLDMIAKTNVLVYYSGDYDPEGLLIADKLKMRYHEQLYLWRYEREDFLNAKSDKMANKRRLAIVNNIQNEKLKYIGDLLSEYPIGYQENILQDYLNDLKNLANI